MKNINIDCSFYQYEEITVWGHKFTVPSEIATSIEELAKDIHFHATMFDFRFSIIPGHSIKHKVRKLGELSLDRKLDRLTMRIWDKRRGEALMSVKFNLMQNSELDSVSLGGMRQRKTVWIDEPQEIVRLLEYINKVLIDY